MGGFDKAMKLTVGGNVLVEGRLAFLVDTRLHIPDPEFLLSLLGSPPSLSLLPGELVRRAGRKHGCADSKAFLGGLLISYFVCLY